MGIGRARGGYRIFEAMRRLAPDFFTCSGDLTYADGVLPAEKPLADGAIWRGVVTTEKWKVTETLAEHRGNYRSNLLDNNLRRFNRGTADLLAARARRALHDYLLTSIRTTTKARLSRIRYCEFRLRNIEGAILHTAELPPAERHR